MASALTRPRAFSICASMPIRPTVVAHGLLDLGEQECRARRPRSASCTLGSMTQSTYAPRALDDLDHVAVGPLGGQVVDPDHPCLARPVALAQRGDDVAARLLLGQRRDGVLQVEEDLVHGQGLGLLREPRGCCLARRAPNVVSACAHATGHTSRTFDRRTVRRYSLSCERQHQRHHRGHRGGRPKKSGILWLTLDRPRLAWHAWHDGAIYLVSRARSSSAGARRPRPGARHAAQQGQRRQAGGVRGGGLARRPGRGGRRRGGAGRGGSTPATASTCPSAGPATPRSGASPPNGDRPGLRRRPRSPRTVTAPASDGASAHLLR